MKIEVGENLVYSYLKHIEGCRIVQTNWKTSGLWQITKYDKKNAKELFNKLKKKSEFKNIFKGNSFDQLIKQAEIDVLGINSTEQTVYGIDIAFHTAGLNYNGGNAEKVMMKIIRTIFILQIYFKEYDRYISYFVTPIAPKKDERKIKELIKLVNSIISDDMITVDFIANDDFFTLILQQVINKTGNEYDNGELFLRSLKLLNLDKTNNSFKKNLQKNDSDTKKKEGMKIGQFVQFHMRNLYEKNLLTLEEIERLQNKDYSKKIFNQNFEILRSSDKDITDSSGRNRYYSREKFFGNYFLTSQWVEYHWEPFLKWLNSVSKK